MTTNRLLPMHRTVLILLFVLTSGCASGPTSRPQPIGVDLSQPLPELLEQLQSGRVSAVEVTEASLAMIDRHQLYGSVIAIAPDAIEQARALDSARARGDALGPLHGVPVLLKDNIESREMPTTAGSLVLAGNLTSRDAPLVTQLRQAGAVIVGKANLSEWANFRSTRSTSGWSGVGGQTRNAHDPSRNPCGSSSGSAVAVALNLAPLAVGTETNGSVVCPSSANGIVGIKPTVGLISRRHIVPISHSQDTAGPMARRVADAALMLQVMAHQDNEDPASRELPAVAWQRDYLAGLATATVQGKRIGVLGGGFHPGVDRLFAQAQNYLEQAGATVVTDLDLDLPEGFFGNALEVLLVEFKHDLNHYLSTLPLPAFSGLTLAELIVRNQELGSIELGWFGQELFDQAASKEGLDNPAYLEALTIVQQATRADGIDRLLREHNLDALISPTNAPAWKTDRVNGDHFIGGSSTAAAVSGYPNITVPMGFVHELPVGLSIYGAQLSEPLLIEIAYAYEQATQHYRAPSVVQ